MNYTKTDPRPKILPSSRYPFRCAECREKFPKGSWMFWFPVWDGKKRLGKGVCRDCFDRSN